MTQLHQRSHEGALGHGAAEKELVEAFWVAAEMRAGGAYAHSVLALDEMAKTSAALPTVHD